MNKMILANYSYICFDFDGVILDTIQLKAEAFTRVYGALEEVQKSYIRDYQIKNGGVSRLDKFIHFEKYLFGVELTKSRSEELSYLLSEYILDNIDTCSHIPGVRDFMEKLTRSGVSVCIATAMPESDLVSILDRISLTEAVYIAKGGPKEKIDQLREINEHFCDDRRQGLYFGDNISDFNAATGAKLDFIGVSSENKFWERGIRSIVDFRCFVT